MQRNPTGGPSLLFRAAGHLCALGLAEVTEVMRPLPVRALAGVPPFVLGVSVIRARPTPVVSVHAILTGTAGPSVAGRFVTARQGGRAVALAVDEVVGVRDVPSDAMAASEPLLTGEMIAGLGVIGDDPLLLLANARLVPKPVWAALDAERGP